MTRRNFNTLQPVVKWVGGKRQLLSEIRPLIPKKYGKYCEPFVGGGAVLFSEKPNNAIVNDSNSELINLSKVIRDNVEELIVELGIHENKAEHFYSVREWDRVKEYGKRTAIEKAARLLFLNKTCYNGLYRVNNAGEFNSPFGQYKNPNIVNDVALRAMSKYFNKSNIAILNGDFEDVLSKLEKNDFVYIDPPYDAVSLTSSFTGYTENGFGKESQIRLRAFCGVLNDKEIKFMLSNSDTEFINGLYEGFTVRTIQAKRSINSRANGRGNVNEVLVTNY